MAKGGGGGVHAVAVHAHRVHQALVSVDCFCWLHPAFLGLLGFLGGTGAPGEGLVAEEVITQKASAQLGEEAEDIPDAIHHGQTPQVLFPIKGCRD